MNSAFVVPLCDHRSYVAFRRIPPVLRGPALMKGHIRFRLVRVPVGMP